MTLRDLMKGDAPVHAPRVVVLPDLSWDSHRPPHFVLTPWTARRGDRWWFTTRSIVPRSRYRDTQRVAWVGLNGGGTDAELRFQVWGPERGDAVYGCANSFRRIPDGDPLLAAPTGKRLFGSRGVYPAAPGDLPVLLDFCDRMLLRLYPLRNPQE